MAYSFASLDLIECSYEQMEEGELLTFMLVSVWRIEVIAQAAPWSIDLYDTRQASILNWLSCDTLLPAIQNSSTDA